MLANSNHTRCTDHRLGRPATPKAARSVDGTAALTQAAQTHQSAKLTFALCPQCRRPAELAQQLVAAPAHPMIGQRQALRSAYASLLKERAARNAPPVRIPPPRVAYRTSEIPIPFGCMLCGVGHQSVSAVVVATDGASSVAHDLWTPKRTGTQQLGGQRSPQELSGYLCRVCADAVEHAHAMGPTALERAVVASLAPQGLGKLPWGALKVSGLVGWGALRASEQVPPNDLDALTEQLGAMLA